MGKGSPLESTFRSDNHYVVENDGHSVFISPDGNYHIFHPGIERWHNGIEQGRTCQLERQDQLQEMMNLPVLDLLAGFRTYYLSLPTIKSLEDFTMEQLWLAFRMKELNKVWDGEKWE